MGGGGVEVELEAVHQTAGEGVVRRHETSAFAIWRQVSVSLFTSSKRPLS